MAVGPVDVCIIGFPGNKFSGRIAPAIMELVESRTIRIIDLLFLSKDGEGVVTKLEAKDIGADGAAFLSFEVAHPGALGAEDAEEVSDDLQQYEQPQAAPPAEDDGIAQLQSLKDLHTQGVLTDEEFAAAKAKILGI